MPLDFAVYFEHGERPAEDGGSQPCAGAQLVQTGLTLLEEIYNKLLLGIIADRSSSSGCLAYADCKQYIVSRRYWRGAMLDEIVGADRGRAGYIARHCQDVPSLFERKTSGVECTAFFAGFGNKQGVTQSGRDPVALDEIPLLNSCAWRVLADQCPLPCDALRELVIGGWMDGIETGGKNRNGKATSFQGRPMGYSIHAKGEAADNDDPCPG